MTTFLQKHKVFFNPMLKKIKHNLKTYRQNLTIYDFIKKKVTKSYISCNPTPSTPAPLIPPHTTIITVSITIVIWTQKRENQASSSINSCSSPSESVRCLVRSTSAEWDRFGKFSANLPCQQFVFRGNYSSGNFINKKLFLLLSIGPKTIFTQSCFFPSLSLLSCIWQRCDLWKFGSVGFLTSSSTRKRWALFIMALS